MKIKKSKYLLFTIASVMSLSNVAMAANVMQAKPVFKITSTILMDKNIIAKPVMVVKQNQKGSVSIENVYAKQPQQLKVAVLAKEIVSPHQTKFIEVNYNIDYKNAKQSFHVQPKILLQAQQTRHILLPTIGEHAYSMNAKAEIVK